MTTPRYVYILADPRDGLNRYVGGSFRNANRVNEHVHGGNKAAKSIRPWLTQMAADGVPVTRKILFTCDSIEEVTDFEIATWNFYKAAGHPLLNGRPGDYPKNCYLMGKKRTPEHQAKLNAAQKGKTFSDEHRAKLSAAKKADGRAAEHCRRIAAARAGKKLSAETRAKMSAAKKADGRVAEHCRRIAAARVGKKRSPDTCAKMSASTKGKPKCCGLCNEPGHNRTTCPQKPVAAIAA